MTGRQARIVTAAGLMAGTALGGGIATGWLMKTGPWPAAAAIAVAAMLLAVVVAAAIPYWRSIDDGARAAHTTAWYWGGSVGAGIGLLAALVIGGGVRAPLAQGAMLTFGFAVVGYVVCWGGWWLMRRRPAAAA